MITTDPGTGILVFDTNPTCAKIYVDSKLYGTTEIDSLQIINVNPGRYYYSIHLRGKHYDNDAIVESDKITHIYFNFNTNKKEEESFPVGTPLTNFAKLENQCQQSPIQSEQEEKTKENISDMSKFFRLANSNSSTIVQKTAQPEYSSDDLRNIGETLFKISNILEKNNRIITELRNQLVGSDSTQPKTEKKYFSTAQTAVTVATANKPESPDVIAGVPAGATGYDRITISDILGHISPKISVINDGNAALYIIASSDGKTWSNDENPILVGEAREFYNVYELRIRSPTAGTVATSQGGVYRVTEYQYSLAYTSTTLFNRTSLTIQSEQNVAALGQQLPNINIPNGFSLVIRATQGNVGSIYVGTTQANTQAAATRATLLAGDSLALYITNANLVFIASSTGAEDVDLVVEQ